MTLKQYHVRSGEVNIWVTEQGNPDKPTLLLVHGFPDDHRVWSSMVLELEHNFHILTMDLRGAGKSSAPSKKTSYRIDQVIPDFWAVINACVGDKPVHLVAHDWGSALAWSFVCEPRYAQCLASYTSLSGPHVALLWDWINSLAKSGKPSQMGKALGQLSHSWYIFATHVPHLPETLFGALGKWVWPKAMQHGGIAVDDPYLQHSPDDIKRISLNTLELYRQNAFKPPRKPEPGSISLPVQLVLLQNDKFIRPYIFDGLEKYASNLTRRTLDANHWAPRSHPKQLAKLVRSYVNSIEQQEQVL